MFSTAGYFKGLNCPFFLSGLCERPYCHFEHTKPDEGKPQLQRSTSNSGYLESLSDKPWSTKSTSSTDIDAEGAQKSNENGDDVCSLQESTKKIIGYNKYTGDPIYEEFKHETYEVELPSTCTVTPNYGEEGKIPVSFNKYTGKPVYESDSSTNHVAANNIVPEYTPTPIEELKKQNDKYLLSNKISNESEYDPEQNYSTKPIKASHSLPVAPKRMISYEPTSIRPAKIPRKTSFEFDISKFSDSEDENVDAEDEEYSPIATEKIVVQKKDDIVNEVTNQKDNLNSEKEDSVEMPGKIMKDVKYFENLLLSDPKKSTLESIKKKLKENEESQENSIISNHVTDTNGKPTKQETERRRSEESKEQVPKVKKDKSGHNNRNSSAKHISNNSVNSKSDDSHKKESGDSVSKSSRSTHEKSDSKTSDSSQSVKKTSKSGHTHSHNSSHTSHRHSKSSSSSNKKGSETTKSHDKNSHSHDRKSSDDKNLAVDSGKSDRHRSSSHRSHSSKHSSDKHDSKKHGDSKEHTKSSRDRSDDSRKASSDHKHASDERKRHKSSRNSSSENNHIDTTDNNASKVSCEKRLSADSDSKKQNNNSSKVIYEKRLSTDSDSKKQNDNSSKVSSEKRLSTDSDSKKHIVDLNVDLFGEDSDIEMLNDSDIESHPLIQDSDLSDNDPYDECLQIFNESLQTKSKHIKKTSPDKKKNQEPVVVGKKRVAHQTSTEVKRKIPEKPYSKLSPAQVMHNRFLEMRKKALEEAAKLHSNALSSSSSSSGSTPNSKSSRVAHKPPSTTPSKTEKTIITTASKSEKRKARVPNVSNLVRPQIPAEFGSKVPTNIRQRYLNLIIDECLKLCDDEEEAFKKGQEEEMAVYKRSNTKTVYLNVAINAIKRLRNEIAELTPSTSKQTNTMNAMKLSHEAVLGGKNATKTTYTINRSGPSTVIENFRGAEFYQRLSKYIMSEEELKVNGYPMIDPEKTGSAIINSDNSYKKNDKLYEKICVRCGKKFVVYPNGKYAKHEECVYHWAKAWKKKVNGLFDSRYNCCQGDLNSEGCQVAKNHVHDTNKWENLTGYIKTLPCSPPVDGDYGVFAMDCEMVYTTAGVELARVTVCDQDNNSVYETLVRPDNEVIDLNTRFSGITDEDLEDVTTTLRDVQAVLLSLFTDKTILIGHSLESDLMAVKIIHNTVVDTSLVFPHRLGLPYKRALRTLMAEYLQKIIQDDVGGHDSMEDAVSCMELMHMKLKEDARKENR